MTSTQKTIKQVKTAAKKVAKNTATWTAAKKAVVKRQVKAAETKVANWSTAKKIGMATAAVAVPIIAVAITAALVKRRKAANLAANAKAHRTSKKAGKA